MTATTDRRTGTTTDVCGYDDLVPDLGVAALLPTADGPLQVALFRLADGAVHAVQNLCPFSGAHVLSRGIVGTRGDVPTIASPVYKQVFSLVDGTCLATMDKAPRPGLTPDLVVVPAAVVDGRVLLGDPSSSVPASPGLDAAGREG